MLPDGTKRCKRARRAWAPTTPLHVHPDHDETFYVIEGELLLHIDGVEFAAGPGAIAMAPRGIAHAFLVTSEQARFLAFVTPGGGVEDFMREAGDPASDRVAPPPGLDIERLVAAGKRTGAMKVLGPPPFDMGRQPAKPANVWTPPVHAARKQSEPPGTV